MIVPLIPLALMSLLDRVGQFMPEGVNMGHLIN